MVTAGGLVFDVRGGERDQQQGDADPIVEAALDVQSLTDARWEPWLGHHRLAERGIGRREQNC